MMLFFTLLPHFDAPSPADDSTVRAVWLADLTADRVQSGTVGRFVFVPDSLVDEHDGCYGVEAAGPPGVVRTVQLAKGRALRASTWRSRSSSRGNSW
jgi:hypothetical protein